MLKINIITLFPDFFESPLKTGILGRSIRTKLLKIHFINPRDFSEDKYQSVDDSPFGGGDGMVIKYEPLKRAIESLSKKKNINNPHTDHGSDYYTTQSGITDQSEQKIKSLRLENSDSYEKEKAERLKQDQYKYINKTGSVIYLSPQGKKWDYVKARTYAKQSKQLTFICGRYAGLDQRFISKYVHEEISIGDYVLMGGESAMLVILDSLCRFIKGSLGNASSSVDESFEHQKLLEAPQWTRPAEIAGYKIPEVILSGHHKKIKQFRYFMSVLITSIKRPDLLKNNPARKDLAKAIQMAQTLSPKELKACGLSIECLKKVKNEISDESDQLPPRLPPESGQD